MGNILTKSQKNLEADVGLHRLSGPWAVCHIIFPIPSLWHKPWVWHKALRLPHLILKNSVLKGKEKKKSETLTVSCFSLPFFFFFPKAV